MGKDLAKEKLKREETLKKKKKTDQKRKSNKNKKTASNLWLKTIQTFKVQVILDNTNIPAI